MQLTGQVPSRRLVRLATRQLRRDLGRFLSKIYVYGGRYAAFDLTSDMERRPDAVARRTGFDWMTFQLLLSDRTRVQEYARDITATVAGRRVLEIGPGPAVVLTRLCLEAGATSVVSVEGDEWVADEARRVLAQVRRYRGRWQIVSKMSTELTAEDVGGDMAFAVLVCEAYGSIACAENVVETVADLRHRGFTFDSVISRGFETWVAPAAAPPVGHMTWLERFALGWGAGSAAQAQERLRSRCSLLYGDYALIDSLRLAPAQLWQAANFETGGAASTYTPLAFTLREPGAYAGLLFHNRILFHDSVLDTGGTPTSWGVMFVPLALPSTALRIRSRVTLLVHTQVADPTQPSSFALHVEANGAISVPVPF